ncbi:MAG: glycerate kinase [Ignavibacteriales bacterium]|nr:MAG: glycerate kinase [Ignavibacteriales bacterium]
MTRILIAPNSFKECADSVTVADLISSSLKEKADDFHLHPELIVKPVSDGGDGFLEVCDNLFGLKIFTVKIPAPFNNVIVDCPLGYSSQKQTVYIESAKVLGLNLIPLEKRHPLNLNSAGLGTLLNYLNKEKNDGRLNFNKVVIGIGGTGTTDFGIGMMAELGLKLFDSYGNLLEPFPYNFSKTSKIVHEKTEQNFDVEVVADVTIPLLGNKGTAKLFAKQKGAAENEIEELENGLQNIVRLLEPGYPLNLYGAGGGLAGAFQYFLNSEIKFADEFIKSDCGLNIQLKPDYVITGEGKYDYQTDLNKAIGVILNEFSESGIPVFIICGKAEKTNPVKNIFVIELESFFGNKNESIQRFNEGILKAAELILKKITE